MITLQGVSKAYQSTQGPISVCSDLYMAIEEQQILALLGPSGCGKTTILHMLAGMEQPDEGSITGIPVRESSGGPSLSYLFQEPRLLPWRTVYQNMDLVLKNQFPDAVLRKKRILEYLSLVGLSSYADLRPHELSGGMKQRAAIARAFAYQSELMLMDEPFQGLDSDLRFQLIDAFLEVWMKRPRTTIMVTHDIREALLVADTIIVLSQRPAQILGELEVTIPRTRRSLGDKELLALEARYYKKFSQRG